MLEHKYVSDVQAVHTALPKDANVWKTGVSQNDAPMKVMGIGASPYITKRLRQEQE